MSDLLETLVQALQAQAARNRGFLSETMARALASEAIRTIQQHGRRGAAPGSKSQAELGQETWEATGELRWFTEHMAQAMQLQQAFRFLEDGRIDWREVPLSACALGLLRLPARRNA